jgi:hypothetical protein
MTVAPNLASSMDLSSVSSDARGTVVAMAAAAALLVGRLLLWLLVQLLKFLVLLAIVGVILAIGFEVGSNWDALSGAAPATGVHHQ